MKSIIGKIEESLNKNESKLNYISVNIGLLGLSLFYYYHYLYTKEDKSFNKITEYIEKSFGIFNKNYKSYSYKLELIELGVYLIFLSEKGFLDEIECYLIEIDDIILEFAEEKIKENNLDNFSGLLKAGHYFLKRKGYQKSEDILNKIFENIELTSIKDREFSYWKFPFRDKNNPIIELGIAHGVAGVISLLLVYYDKDIDIDQSKHLSLITSSVNFLISQIDRTGVNWFPINAFEASKYNYNSLNYGDIGIGYNIYIAGKLLKNKHYLEEGIKILENAAEFRDELNEYIHDANLVYGAFGMYTFFRMMYESTKNVNFLVAKEYWFKKGLDFGNNDTSWAGFDTYIYGDNDYMQLSFSSGIIGIGIALITSEMKNENEFLSFLNYTVETNI